MQPGDIYRDAAFYVNERGELCPKYLLLLAVSTGADIVARLLATMLRWSRHA